MSLCALSLVATLREELGMRVSELEEGQVLVAEGHSKTRPLTTVDAPTRRLRLLVVEDHEVLRCGLRWLLTRVAWVERCVVAASVEEALTLAQGQAFDLALVDIGLGLAACERLSGA